MAHLAYVCGFVIGAASSVEAAVSSSRFNCSDFRVPARVPVDVRTLHPGHISFVMAVGDSITAAFSARSDLLEARDISWSTGVGNAQQLTVPFMISRFNPKVAGASTKAVLPADLPHIPHGDYHPMTDHLNVAESEGAVHRNSMVEQWSYLNASARLYEPAFSHGWKMLTVWMTANDVCGMCHTPLANTSYLAKWIDGYDALLHNVSKTFSNVYVSLLSTLDLSHIHRLQRTKLGCTIEHKFVHECGCVGQGNTSELRLLDANVHTMNAALRQLAIAWQARLQAQGRSDMAVVYQNFMEGIGAQLDISFLSRLDCFHPSTVGHEDLAIGLWNGLLCSDDRAHMCGRPFRPNLAPFCPTVDTVLYAGP